MILALELSLVGELEYALSSWHFAALIFLVREVGSGMHVKYAPRLCASSMSTFLLGLVISLLS